MTNRYDEQYVASTWTTDNASGERCEMKKWGECSGVDVILHESWAANENDPVWALVIHNSVHLGTYCLAHEVVGELGKEGWIVRLSRLSLELVPLRCVAMAPKVIYIVRAKTTRDAVDKVPIDDLL